MRLKNKKRVVIVGMGFGGLEAARHLAGHGLEVLCLDRQNYHLFQPLLYQVATATLDQESIAYPVRSIIGGWKDVQFRMAEVGGINLEAREVLTDSGNIPYDYLILAPGSVTNFFGLESVVEHAYDLKKLPDAVKLRNQVLGVFEQAVKEPDEAKRQALMTFVIVGGGPTGVEFSGALAELSRHMLERDYPTLRLKDTRIILVEALDHLLGPYPESLREYAQGRLENLGVEVRLSTLVSGAEAGKVLLKDGDEIAAHTLFWAAGVQAAPLAEAVPVPKARGGRIPVRPDMSLETHPELFVIGDMAYYEQDEKPLPMVAPVAIQQGAHAAKAILAREAKTENAQQEIEPFRYLDKGSMAIIGRNAAIATSGGLKFKGFIAWLMWLGLHILFLIGFRNRAVTLLSWAYDYIFSNRQARLIVK